MNEDKIGHRELLLFFGDKPQNETERAWINGGMVGRLALTRSGTVIGHSQSDKPCITEIEK
jgi:hypothetical protein